MPIAENQAVPLEIYLAYDFLPASLLARTLTVLDTLYETVARDAFLMDLEKFSPEPDWVYDYRLNWPLQPWLPLCIDTVETGNSIKVGFAARGRLGSARWKDGDFEILLPRSTAPLCVIGVLLTGGAWSYEQYLKDELTRAQIANVQIQTEALRSEEKLTQARVALIRAQTAAILDRQLEREKQPRSPHGQAVYLEIRSQIQNFMTIVGQPSVTRAQVNGVDIHHALDRDP